MKVIYNGKEKLKDGMKRGKRVILPVFRYNFTAEVDGERFPFHTVGPGFKSQIYLDEQISLAKSHILFGLTVMENYGFISETIMRDMLRGANELLLKETKK
jgi:hypothetical protein